MQKIIRSFMVFISLMWLNQIIAAGIHMPTDTTIKSFVTLKEYPITNLATVPVIKRGDPEVYYGKWQWVNDNRDTFTITLMPGKEKTTKDVMAIQPDIICNYTVIRQGQLVESSVQTHPDSEHAMQTELYGSAMEKMLVIFYQSKMINLDGSINCELQLVDNNKEKGILRNGAYLPCFARVFGNKSTLVSNNIPADLIMKKISNSY